MNKLYYAHSENGKGDMHLLKDHLLGTSNIAQSFAFDDYTKKVFRLSGLLHDFGKYQEAFQQYLINGGKRGSVPHSEFGAGYARIINLLDISFAIDGHHKGIPDKSTWQADTDSYKNNDSEGFNSLRGTYFEDMQFTKIDFFVESHAYKSFERELFIRLIFSALTDADWLDTESHFQPDVSLDRVNQTLQVDRLIEKLEAEFDGKSKEGEINRLRNLARTETLNHTGEPCGFYSLNLPTGLGKTLTSMIWALNHAKQNRLKRIFVVLPYINIIDQTAKVFKSIFGEEAVLEHHSNYNENDDTADAGEAIIDSVEKSKRLACENWDYPVIVTTTVQFFESLFSNRPARCRKVHNIAESVVIFDEVQTLPKESVLPTLNMLKNMQAVMRTSFLFCTATQPAFEKQEMFNGIKMIHPLISNPEELFEKTRRVDYCLFENLSPVNYDVLMDAVIKNSTSVLIIFNTKKATRDFYLLASESAGNWDKTYQLSTAMCPAHRKSVIESIRDDLKYGLKILVSSTQLIEAGVDFDFPCVFRALAPLEGIIQAAGRCNREGNMPARGKVYIFQPEDGGMPDKTYRACAEHAGNLILEDINSLHSHDSFKKYYSQVVRLFVNPDKNNIDDARLNFNFETVNDSYRIIDQRTHGIFIYNFDNESKSLFHDIEHKPALSRNDFRRMQQYTIQVYPDFLRKNEGLFEMRSQGFIVWWGDYNMEIGLPVEPVSSDKYVV